MKFPKAVFCHYLVRLTFNQTDHRQYDIGNATTSAIDGFALNIDAGDHHTLEALRGGYDAAAKIGNFSLFLSFDFGATGNWTVDSVATLINDFKDEPAQFRNVRNKVLGNIYFVPDWSSLGYEGVKNVTDEIDGHFSFDAWPQRGETRITTRIDKLYQKVLGSTRSYMMGVSPYFYTNLKSLSKNWYSSSDSLWHDRLEQLVDLQPDFAQIISWNDFGESHYISLRAVLPWYVAAYKAGSRGIPMPASLGDGVAVAWYRTTPANLTKCDDGGSHWGQNGTLTAKAAVVDSINVIAITAKADTTISVELGNGIKTLAVPPGAPRFFQIPFEEFQRPVGKVQTVMNGLASADGPEITDKCPKTGIINFNAAAVDVRVPSPEESNSEDDSAASTLTVSTFASGLALFALLFFGNDLDLDDVSYHLT